MLLMRGAVSQTLGLVNRLLLQSVPEDEILSQLRVVPGGQRTLRRAAKDSEDLHYWPATRAETLLLAAADGREAPVQTPEEEGEVADVRELTRLDTAAAFAMLAQRVPPLRELEAAALDPEQARSLLERRGASDPERLAQVRLWPLIREAATMIGPRSSETDRLTASPAAFIVVSRHLHALLGVPHPGS